MLKKVNIILFIFISFSILSCQTKKKSKESLEKAISYLNNDKFSMAKGALNNFIEKNPDDWKGYYYLAMCYLRGGSLAGDEDAFNNFSLNISSSANLKPFKSKEYLNIAKKMILDERFYFLQEGKILIKKFINKGGDHREAFLLMADFYKKGFKLQEELDVLKKSCLKYSNPEDFFRITSIYKQQSETDSLKKYLNLGIKNSQGSVPVKWVKIKDSLTILDKILKETKKYQVKVEKHVKVRLLKPRMIVKKAYASYDHSTRGEGEIKGMISILNPLQVNITSFTLEIIYKKKNFKLLEFEAELKKYNTDRRYYRNNSDKNVVFHLENLFPNYVSDNNRFKRRKEVRCDFEYKEKSPLDKILNKYVRQIKQIDHYAKNVNITYLFEFRVTNIKYELIKEIEEYYLHVVRSLQSKYSNFIPSYDSDPYLPSDRKNPIDINFKSLSKAKRVNKEIIDLLKSNNISLNLPKIYYGEVATFLNGEFKKVEKDKNEFVP